MFRSPDSALPPSTSTKLGPPLSTSPSTTSKSSNSMTSNGAVSRLCSKPSARNRSWSIDTKIGPAANLVEVTTTG